MKALVVGAGSLSVVDRPLPEPDEATAIVRVHTAGVCNTDLEITRGYMRFEGVLGHELVGTVIDGPAEWHGKRVVGEINFACGVCDLCRTHLGRHCPTRTVMGILGADGAFAEAVRVPVGNLHAVPESIADDEAVFVEPLAAAFEILDQLQPSPGLRCTVLGDGKLGLLVAQVLDVAGLRVTAVGRHESKLSILRQRGIETVCVADWDGRPADIVVEATGTIAGFQAAMAATRPRGTLVLKSTVAEGAALNLAPVVINEINVVGSRCGPFTPALQALAKRQIDVASLIAARFPLSQGLEALQHAAAPGVLKVLIHP